MSNIKLFQDQKIRATYNEAEQKWYFAIIDVVQVLVENLNARRYWSDLKRKLIKEYAILTAEISKATFGLTPSEYKEIKGLKRENLRDHMTDLELIFSMLGEDSTTEIAR